MRIYSFTGPGWWQDRCLEIAYRFWFGGEMRDRVAPYGLVARGSDWYLVYSRQGNLRAVRVADLENVTLLPETFERPPDFDLAAFWAVWSDQQADPAYPVTLAGRARSATLAAALLRRGFQTGRGAFRPPDEQGWRTLDLSFDSLESARARLLGFGGSVEVLSPESLRLSLADFARQIVARYHPGSSESG